MVLSTHMKTSFTGMVSALFKSSLRRVANKAACNSTFYFRDRHHLHWRYSRFTQNEGEFGLLSF